MELIVGQNYFVRTVTDYWVGRLVKVDGPYTVTLDEVSWVAGTGRLGEFVLRGQAEGMEIEYLGPDHQAIQWLAIRPWRHPLFTRTIP